MAMLRVSSYRRLFEEALWSQGSGTALRAAARVCQREEPDFDAARILTKESLGRLAQERAVIATLNDRLAVLIETVRCLEEENEALEVELLEHEENQEGPETVIKARIPGWSLDVVVDQLGREKDEVLCHVAKLKEELVSIRARYEDVIKQRELVHLEREEVAAEVDALTTECLSLRDQVAIYNEQLAAMQETHETHMESLVEPKDAVALVTTDFPTPEVTPAILGIKEYYRELAESLQYKSKAIDIVIMDEECHKAKVPKASNPDITEVTDINDLRKLIAELEKERTELERKGEELVDEIEEIKAFHLEELEELESCVAELEDNQAELEAEMREQCGDYDELLSKKMALDIEITAYRGLVEVEESRLCYF